MKETDGLVSHSYYKMPGDIEATDDFFSTLGSLPDESIEFFIQSQTRIRVLFDNGVNFGNQAASVNLIARLREMGFQGVIEAICPFEAAEKVALLFNLSMNNLFSCHEDLKVEFIELNIFLKNSQNYDVLPLGLTGAVDYVDHLADLLNVEVFVQFSPYHQKKRGETRIWRMNDPRFIVQEDTHQRALIVPHADFTDAKSYLAKEEYGSRYAALNRLIQKIECEEINFFPAYGYPVMQATKNWLNLILGAQYAQTHGDNNFKKPVVIGIFHELSPMVVKTLYDHPDLPKDKFKVIYLKDNSAIESLNQLASDKIVMVSMGKLPKILFDGLFTHTAPNVFPCVREGASSLSSIIQTGKPHIHCEYYPENSWDIDLSLASPSLQEKLKTLQTYACFKKGENGWHPQIAAEKIGEFIIAAQNNNSDVSQFFQQLRDYHLERQNDRILIGLNVARHLSGFSLEDNELNTLLSTTLHRGNFSKVTSEVVSSVPDNNLVRLDTCKNPYFLLAYDPIPEENSGVSYNNIAAQIALVSVCLKWAQQISGYVFSFFKKSDEQPVHKNPAKTPTAVLPHQ